MEASRLPPREADVAPDPDPTGGRLAGWTPADPAPLGLASFAVTTFVLSVINANLVSITALPAVFGLALVAGGLAQLIAGVWEFRNSNTFGAVAFCSYGSFWISLYILLHTSVTAIPKAESGAAIGLFLWAWSIFTLIMLVASLRTTAAVAFTILLLEITFILLAIGFSGTSSGTIHLGGYFGIATALAAWYVVAAAVINATWGKTMLPVFPMTG